MTEAAPGPEILPLIAPPKVQRLLSLDVFRGVTIFAMLIVNNLYATPSGYFWKHADWIEPWPRQAYSQWRKALNSGNLTFISAFTQFPLFKHCTLADYVMPWFMLIIGLAIPYSAASMESKGLSPLVMWRRLLKRAAMLVLLGWILCYFRDQFSDYLHNPIATFHISLGMDVLQLLGVAYLLARILYELPPFPRLTIACVLFIWHWAFLRYLPQGDIAAGTFAESAGHQFSAAQYAYDHWPVFQTFTLIPGRLTMNWIGLLSVPPAAATMLLGTLAGDFLRRPDLRDTVKAHDLAWLGAPHRRRRPGLVLRPPLQQTPLDKLLSPLHHRSRLHPHLPPLLHYRYPQIAQMDPPLRRLRRQFPGRLLALHHGKNPPPQHPPHHPRTPATP